MFANKPPMQHPTSTAWNSVAHFGDYEAAQHAVDQLSDDGFPVEKLDIVGSNLRLVERVTGRLTKARAAGAGAISGMWAAASRCRSVSWTRRSSGSSPGWCTSCRRTGHRWRRSGPTRSRR